MITWLLSKSLVHLKGKFKLENYPIASGVLGFSNLLILSTLTYRSTHPY